ncbi:HIRAN domain-containing protein [Prevotella sp. khp7]|uniref:HIRAN domain-containing protein n=1 Tax=Prevotella sp. khp7 TaxID=1761885 RepID=UPI0008D36BD6|nr:HIRAN domain-containing protein [Prevotella sp. khp7]SEW12889.1 HIRAN domain-containing protein [Prevotella sp. khp7]
MVLLIFFGIVVVFMVFMVMNVKNNTNEETQRELDAKLAGEAIPDLIEEVELMTRKCQTLIQAEIVGDIKTIDAINDNSYNGPLPEKRDDGGFLSIYENLRILKIAGINYRQGINRYLGRVECALVPEPQNEYDSNAIKVVASDRHHLGYIPSDMTDLVRSMAGEEFPMRCTCFIDKVEDEFDGHKFFVGYVYIKHR